MNVTVYHGAKFLSMVATIITPWWSICQLKNNRRTIICEKTETVQLNELIQYIFEAIEETFIHLDQETDNFTYLFRK